MNGSAHVGCGRVSGWTPVVLGVVLLAPPVASATAPSSPIAPAAPASSYRVAVTGGIAVGDAGWGTELGGISELAARVQVLPWLGVGLSYFQLSAGNNEGDTPFVFSALEVSAAWRPVVGRWFDPFVQAGVLSVLGSHGGYMGIESTSRFGLEGMAGFDLVRLPFAVGVHARSGGTNRNWVLAGLHLELRI